MEKEKIAFIINPVSGTKPKLKLPIQVKTIFDGSHLEPYFFYAERAGHATELAKELVDEKFPYVVAVGGDGTVNEVGRGLIHTDTAMGIIPFGSGNGLARHLNIPLNTKKAIEYLKTARQIEIDYCKANEKVFFCTCGTGFDAQVSYEFSLADGRGLRTYVKKTLSAFLNYKPQKYRLINNQVDIEQEAFLITFANASQYGNNAYIAPHADLQDGLLDIVILSRFPLTAIPELAIRLFSRQIDKSSYMNTLRAKEITLQREKGGAFHFDGETDTAPETLHIKVVRNGLKIMLN